MFSLIVRFATVYQWSSTLNANHFAHNIKRDAKTWIRDLGSGCRNYTRTNFETISEVNRSAEKLLGLHRASLVSSINERISLSEVKRHPWILKKIIRAWLGPFNLPCDDVYVKAIL
jgi:hypothetical protein